MSPDQTHTPTPVHDVLDRAAAAALSLAADQPWNAVSLRLIAERAGLSLAELYAAAPSKTAVMDHLSRRFDQAALNTPDAGAVDAHERLFEAVMARIEAMEPHRHALIAIGRDEGAGAILARFPRTARALLETAGIEATPVRRAAMTLVWARTVQVWRDDEGALNRTMAEIDRRLKAMRRGLVRMGAGF